MHQREMFREKILNLAGILLLFALVSGCRAEGKKAKPDSTGIIETTEVERYAQTIILDDLEKVITTLASDRMEGRHTGTEGSQMAADFIAETFKALRLEKYSQESGYFQKFPMVKKKLLEGFVQSAHAKVESWKDYMELFSEFEGEKCQTIIRRIQYSESTFFMSSSSYSINNTK